ncbi:hypothetical protein XELAEV_18021327mg [Xenopus laevis]|uniref:Uncharacterized protein n=1 Tax=Xenopus laevis TaxID=8355 RepID=A0A974DB30_XENLA|nr:hypothetical protein XELAEV_18021327mg [Xenopus laevis]
MKCNTCAGGVWALVATRRALGVTGPLNPMSYSTTYGSLGVQCQNMPLAVNQGMNKEQETGNCGFSALYLHSHIPTGLWGHIIPANLIKMGFPVSDVKGNPSPSITAAASVLVAFGITGRVCMNPSVTRGRSENTPNCRADP